MRATDAQVRKLMKEHARHGNVERASLAAGLSRNTGAKYLKSRKLPSEEIRPRDWRTRQNPFEQDWPEIVGFLEDLRGVETKTIFELLMSRSPDRYQPGQLRTLQRHVRQWNALHGPAKEVFFSQAHRPGEAMQTDFTHASKLGVTIRGEHFDHMLCHVVLPYSNWDWATVCRSESMAALKRGIQQALKELGRSPEHHQTDNSTAATHKLDQSSNGRRGFNDDYVSFCEHFGMSPRTIAVGKSNQNGDVEASHRVLKRRLMQCLLLRQSVDFECVSEYEAWLQEHVRSLNVPRTRKLEEELSEMKALPGRLLPEFTEETVGVNGGSTIRVKHNAYSVPSRLIGENVKVRIYDDRLEVYYNGKIQLQVERLVGKGKHRINYRHIIQSLVRKPGAFPRYSYRDEMFPSLVFRRAYDQLTGSDYESARLADLEYLRILELAARHSEPDVETALHELLESSEQITSVKIKEKITPRECAVPSIQVPTPDLSQYDELLKAVAV